MFSAMWMWHVQKMFDVSMSNMSQERQGFVKNIGQNQKFSWKYYFRLKILLLWPKHDFLMTYAGISVHDRMCLDFSDPLFNSYRGCVTGRLKVINKSILRQYTHFCNGIQIFHPRLLQKIKAISNLIVNEGDLPWDGRSPRKIPMRWEISVEASHP